MEAVLLALALATTHVVQPRTVEPARHHLVAPGRHRAASSAPPVPIELYEVNLDEKLLLRPGDERGRARKATLAGLTRFLRCRHTGRQHRVDPRLLSALYVIGRHYPGQRIEVFSGYRPRAFCTRPHSRHLTASAIDFRVAGVRNEALIAWLRARFHPAGVGYYPNGVHVHLDLDRARDTYWVDAGDDVGNVATADAADADGEDDGRVIPLPALPTLVPLAPPMDDPAFVD